MPGVHRDTDLTTGHSCPTPRNHCGFAPPTSPAEFSEDVFVNGLGVVRYGDRIVPHECSECFQDDIPPCTRTCPSHTGTYQGEHTVYVNGKYIQLEQDPIINYCPKSHLADTGSPDVFVEG